jgi:hypothetical protein
MELVDTDSFADNVSSSSSLVSLVELALLLDFFLSFESTDGRCRLHRLSMALSDLEGRGGENTEDLASDLFPAVDVSTSCEFSATDAVDTPALSGMEGFGDTNLREERCRRFFFPLAFSLFTDRCDGCF